MTLTSTNENRILGFGELSIDHIFAGTEVDTASYLESCGGGSVWNLLANLASFGRRTVAAIIDPSDELGRYAVTSLESVGVDIQCIGADQRSRTRAFFAMLHRAPLCPVETGHRFTDRCFICGERPSRSSLAANLLSDDSVIRAGDVVCIDNLNASGVEVARTAKRAGATTVLDCGHLSPLRYKPITAILKALCMFDLILAPSRVANSIVRRSGLSSDADLARKLGPRKVLVVSDGPKGATVLDTLGSELSWQYLPPFTGIVEDAAGAGDRLLAVIVDALLDAGAVRQELIASVTQRIPRDLAPVLQSRGARGHLNKRSQNWSLTPFVGQTVSQIRNVMLGSNPCPFCGARRKHTSADRAQRPQKTGILSNIDDLGRRALFAAEKHEPLALCREILRWKGTAFVVATGGSFSSAVFISSALNRFGEIFCQPIKPLDYARLSKFSDYLFIVSYSGSTKDCAQAIRLARGINVKTIVLVTSKTDPPLKSLLRPDDLVISYGNGHSRERGFVSVAGTVAPCTLWAAACLGTADIAPLAEHFNGKWLEPLDLTSLVHSLEGNQAIDVFGGGDSWPAVLDLESKMIEGDLGRATLHEVKDFSHGRFLHTFSPHSARQWLVFRTADNIPYEDELVKVLAQKGNVCEIRAATYGLLGGLELLVKVQYFSVKLGQLLHKDISRPRKIPAEGLKLYRWED